MAENAILKDPTFQSEQLRAALIGKYAVHRYTYMAISQRLEYRKLKYSHKLWSHLQIIQDTVHEYITCYTKNLVNSAAYRELCQNNRERANRLLQRAVEIEEERIGNKWICVENPGNSKSFCHWKETAESAYKTRETERLRKNADNIDTIFGFNKYGEYSIANVRNGELFFPLEKLYEAIYLDIKMLEEESLSADERVEILHRRREREDHIYKFMKMRESIEQSYKIIKK